MSLKKNLSFHVVVGVLFILRWWSPSTMWVGLLHFDGHHRGGPNNPLFSNMGLCAACWAHFMCQHQLCQTSMSQHFSSLNSSLGFAGGKYHQKITFPIFKLVLQNFAFPSSFPYSMFYCCLIFLLSSGWVVIVVCDSISVQGTNEVLQEL